MKQNKAFFFFIPLVLLFSISCSLESYSPEDDITPSNDNFRINEYHGVYAQYSNGLILDPTHDNLVKFEYDENNRITRRTGDIFYTAIGSVLSDSLFTDITYYNDKAYLVKGISYSGYSIDREESILTYYHQQVISQKITIKQTNGSSDIHIDTTNYSYLNSRLKSYTKTYNKLVQGTDRATRYFEESNLYYTYGNLDSITTIYSYKPNFTDYTVFQRKETQIFEAYDTSQNPFRKLQLFNETFNRSLSVNNFAEYRKIVRYYSYPNNDYYQTPILTAPIEVNFQNWMFAYDEDGELIYDSF